MPLSSYLFCRLRQLGIHHVFGVPGDYGLALLDVLLTQPGPRWVGTANELGAAYAADGYARERGLGAVLTTFGVGELSAVNAIAGAYAENVPVIQITAAPPTAALTAAPPTAAGGCETLHPHHSLADGDLGHFARMYQEITAAATVLDHTDPVGELDRVLTVAITTKLPVYVAIPCDLVHHPVPTAPLRRRLVAAQASAEALDAIAELARQLLSDHPDAVLVAGHLVDRFGRASALRAMVEAAGVPVAVTTTAKGLVDEHHPLYLGVYQGRLSPPALRRRVESASARIMLGAVLADTMTGAAPHNLPDDTTLWVGREETHLGRTRFAGVPLGPVMDVLATAVLPRERSLIGVPVQADRGRGEAAARLAAVVAHPDDDRLTQTQLWQALQAQLPQGCVLVADIGTAAFGALELTLPAQASLVSGPIWGSIGYALPAGLGIQLAAPQRRTVVIIGDGAAQMTIQELGTIAREGLHPVIIVINNGGYTVERFLGEPHASYNDITLWDWAAVPAALGCECARVQRATTHDELVRALRTAFSTPDELVFLEVCTAAFDAPTGLATLAAAFRGGSGQAGHHNGRQTQSLEL